MPDLQPADPATAAHRNGARPSAEVTADTGAMDPERLANAESARTEAYFRFREKENAGELDAYAGEFVVGDGRDVFANDVNLVAAHQRAEAVARAKGVDPAFWTEYFVLPVG